MGQHEVSAGSSVEPRGFARLKQTEGEAGVKVNLPRGRRAQWGSCSAPQATAGPSRGCCNIPRTRRTCPSARQGQSLSSLTAGRQADALRCADGRASRPGRTGLPQTLRDYTAGRISGKMAPTSCRPLSLHFCPSSVPSSLSNLSGSSMAQGQVYRLKPRGLGLNPGSAFPAVNLGKLPDLSVLRLPHL